MKIPNWMKGDAPISNLICSMPEEDEGGGGGGGGGGGDDGGDGDDGPDEKTQKFITDTVNKALGSRLKRTEASLKESLGEMIGSSISDALKDFKPPAGGEGDKDKGGGGGEKSDDMKAMEARIKDAEDRAKAVEEERKQERETAKRNEERDQLREGLRQAKVAPELVPAAVALLINDRNILGRNDQDEVVWKAQRDGYIDELSIADGVKEFLGTQEGKAYLPPDGEVGGSGNRGGKKPNMQRSDKDKMSREEAINVLGEALMDPADSPFGGR